MDLPSENFLGKNVRRDKTSDLFSEKKKKNPRSCLKQNKQQKR